MSTLGVVLCFYFGLNFLAALLLHIHGEGQAHLRLRWADVAVHFFLLTAVGIPVLLCVTLAALFAREPQPQSMAKVQQPPRARAA